MKYVLTSTGWGPVILEDVVDGLLWRLGEPIFFKAPDVRCCTVNTTWEDAIQKIFNEVEFVSKNHILFGTYF